MSQPKPSADLDEILRQTRHFLLDFNGPVCTLYPGQTATMVARRLLTTIAALSVELPESIAKTTDPLAVLSLAAAISPDLAVRIESELTDQELAAAATATPAGDIHELVSSCRESRRSVTVLSNNSTRAVQSFLERNSLDGAVGLVLARNDADMPRTDGNLIDAAISALQTTPASCALVTASIASLEAARLAGARTIGYARTPGMPQTLTAAGADTAIPSLADLVLRLRAQGPAENV